MACLSAILPLPTIAMPTQTAAESSWVKNPKNSNFCAGSYQSPKPSSDENKAYIEADRSEFNFDETAILEGNIVLRNGAQQVRADSATYDIQHQKLTLEGNLSIQGSGLILNGTKAVLSTDATTGTIDNASYVLPALGARGGAQQIKRTGETSISLKNGFYTSCPPGDNSWKIAAKSIELDHEKGLGVAKNATLKVKNIPVIVIPYLPFPIGDTRRSGILWPSFGSVKNASGIDYAQPVYWNIAPHADATITPRIVGDRGLGLENELRYLNTFSAWQLSGSYFSDNQKDKDRWLAAVKENGQFSNNWFHTIDFSRVSDDDYFEDYDVTSLDVQRQTHLLQSGQLHYRGKRYSSSLAVEQFQTIEAQPSEPYRLLPQFSLSTNSQNLHGKAELFGELEYTDFDTDDRTVAKGQRLYYETGVALPLQWLAGYIHTTASIKGIRYTLDKQHALIANTNEPSVNTPSATVDAGLVFEKTTGNNGRQTLEPRAVYTYTKFQDQTELPVFDSRLATQSLAQQYRDSRFSGHDRIDNANQLTVGITHRQFNSSGRQVASMAVAQTVYFDDKQVFILGGKSITDSVSPIVSEFILQPTAAYRATINIASDNNFDHVGRARWRLSYQNDANLLLSASQVYNRNETNNKITDQTELSAAIPLNRQWTFYAQHHYDKRNTRSVQNTFGFAYESCCWKVRTLFQQSLDDNDVTGTTDSGFFIEFELKGLGGTGAATERILDDAIYGFSQ